MKKGRGGGSAANQPIATQGEDNFKVCGLCSQLVDESVQLDQQLRTFLFGFINDVNVPTKVCTDCYQGTVECKRFRDRCLKANEKLKKTKISSSMILGLSASDLKDAPIIGGPIRAPSPPPPKTPKSSKKEKESPAPPPSLPRSRRSGRKATKSVARPNAEGSNCHVVVKYAEKELADRVFVTQGVSRSKKPLPAAATAKPKKLKKGYAYEVVPAEPAQPAKAGPRSAKRKRTPGYVDENETVDDASPPPKKGKGKKGYYYVDETGPVESVPQEEEEEADDEEIFPSIGPYQCEICQKITDTKQEFVNHIKKFHRSVVDEAVLKSLENDLKKSKKKQQKAAAAATGSTKNKKAASLKVPPKRRAPAPKKKPAAGKRKKPSAAARPPRRPPKTAANKAAVTCDLCSAVVPRVEDMERHQQSRACTRARSKNSSANNTAIECQYCNKMVDPKDLDGHYMTKACMAKKYEKQSSEEAATVNPKAENEEIQKVVENVLNEEIPPVVAAPEEAAAAPGEAAAPPEAAAVHIPEEIPMESTPPMDDPLPANDPVEPSPLEQDPFDALSNSVPEPDWIQPASTVDHLGNYTSEPIYVQNDLSASEQVFSSSQPAPAMLMPTNQTGVPHNSLFF